MVRRSLSCCLVGASLFAPAPRAQPASWKAGTAKASITPDEPMWMAGYAGRRRPAKDRVHDLWAKALALEAPDGARAVLVTLDVTGIDRRFSLAVRDELKERYGLERREIALCSSHTHSGPVTSEAIQQTAEALGLTVSEYVLILHREVVGKILG